jgi:hypothetical protein
LKSVSTMLNEPRIPAVAELIEVGAD